MASSSGLVIVADADIPGVDTCFSALAELRLLPGREISRRHLQNADALLVRSVTAVDGPLLDGTPVKLVGTATSGLDHVDSGFLQDQGIELCHTRGSNANAVVDYCFAALAMVESERGLSLHDKQFGLVGAGHVGGFFASRLVALGMRCVVHDPLLAKESAAALLDAGVDLVSLEAALQSDVISLHVPLTLDGPHATRHLLSKRRLAGLNEGSILLNTSRGAVVDNQGLEDLLRQRQDLTVILDVWENEPAINRHLLERVALGTPHVAGYSIEAKLKATGSLLSQFCAFFGLPIVDRQPASSLSKTVSLDPSCQSMGFFCHPVLRAVVPLKDLHQRLGALDSGVVDDGFDRLRLEFAGRHEFNAIGIEDRGLNEDQRRFLVTLGFQLNPR